MNSASFWGEICQPEIIMWIVVIIVPLISRFGVGLSYISVKDIISNHLGCFKREDGKFLIIPTVNYVVLPFFMGIATVQIKTITDGTLNIITIIISIITAMLFTMLTMIIDMKGKIRQNKEYYSMEAKVSEKALLEAYYTVMFEILICVILLILCLFSNFTKRFDWIKSFFIYSFTYMLFINLLMILKRIFRVIDNDMRK